ncbi:regulator of G-protein signaling loco isoform X2 [Fopius arisanus]|uniref:RGS12 protein n=1 Tax=Fopius arisanus TaxID=64838 RepID=A0A0C9QN45_9HYME|nr:PREDICTED: regulator of G-protein signaling loco isoform X2 [Fopius arisanus]
MHHNRRKKKRINYGVRAVELMRGSKGFGFTISGQQPCILSCIVAGSPAEIAGLRAGDYLVTVNGHNVGKAPHDDVVRLIGHSKGILRLQIAENYYSDSSDEEGPAASRSKPKYSHKQRNSNATPVASGPAPAGQLQCRVAKVVRDLQSGAMFTGGEGERVVQSKILCSQNGVYHRWNMASAPLPPPPHSHKRDAEKIVHRTVVGYLGTIDIPNQLHPSTMMPVLRKCIKRLKAEKRTPTTVLLTIHVANIKLTNSENKIIAEYPSHRIVFCNSFSEQDKQYFGIVTKSANHTDEIVSNSCHVFTIYYKLIEHAVHLSTCNMFGFTCTKTSELTVCQEFPDSCNGLIGAIQTLYISETTDSEAFPESNRRQRREAVSPQPSNISTSTAHSSNSDSGIGFKDEYGSHYSATERNINLDFSHRRLPIPSNSRLTVRATQDSQNERGISNGDGGTRDGGDITCPGPSAALSMTKLDASSVGSSTFSRTIAGMLRTVDAEDMEFCDTAGDKLSPKVFNASKTLVHSMEDLKNEGEAVDVFAKPADVRPWGSLQEIRNVGGFQSNSSLYGSVESCDKNDAGLGVRSWGAGFENLLKDPRGLQTFAEFLKKEFSHENIYFWAACERYKDTEDATSRRRLAWQIYQRHLSNNAPEPVNVDSHAAGQITQELLNRAPEELFLQAQKQVFNLMKFDSYPRFLKSNLYHQCKENGIGVRTEDHDLDLTSSPSVKLKKSHSDAEDRCRKSILPWHRKNRSKSKDRGESEYNKTPSRGEPIYKSFTTIKRDTEGNNNDDTISISSSRSSLASWDLALRQSFSKHMINLKYSSSVLAGQEVEVVPTKALKVDLPSRRIITVVAHKNRTLREVLRPLLNKYGFKLELITIWGEGHPVSLEIPAINAPSRLVLTSNNEDFQRDSLHYQEDIEQGQSQLDEITNKVFEELLVGKSTNKYYSEGSYKSDDQRSEGSSILSSKLFTRDTTVLGKKKGKSKSSNLSEKSNSTDYTGEESSQSSRPHAPLIAKWRNGVKLQLPGRFDGDELYEGLKRAQRSRLEDQRGTEINFELPDFLKQNKENGKHTETKKHRRGRLLGLSSDCASKFYDSSDDIKKANLVSNPVFEKCHYNSEEGQPISKPLEPSKRFDSVSSLDGTLEDVDKTIIENGNGPNQPKDSFFENQFVTGSPGKLSKPPPLPPKPKGLLTCAVKTSQILPTKPLPRVTQISPITPLESRENKNIF